MRVACFWFDRRVDTEKVAELCLRFSPQICVKSNHAVFVEIGRCSRLYSERSFMARAQILLKRYGLNASIYIGNHIHDALVFARYQITDLDLLPIEALLDLCDPFGKDEIGRKYVQKLIDALKELGVKNIDKFRRIPSRELSSRFGPAGLLCRQRLDHEVIVPWPAWHPREEIIETIEYPYGDFKADLEILSFEIKKILDRLFTRLFSRGLKLLKAVFVIQTEKNSVNSSNVRTFTFHFLLPQGSTKGALAILRERLGRELQRQPLIAPIEKIEIQVLETARGGFGQKNLFHDREEEQNHFNALIAQLSEIYGAGKIFQAKLVEDRVPEKSWQAVSSLDPSVISLKGRIPIRPTHLQVPEKVDLTDTHICIRKKFYAITYRARSIERISSHWLDGLIEREYFQLEVESQAMLWIFQDQNKNFYLHGYFG